MRIFETYRELGARTEPRLTAHDFFVCADCGAVKQINHDGGTGYAVADGEQMICYDCDTERERKRLLDRSKPFYAYVSSNGAKVTTWPGGVLGSVRDLTYSRFGRSEMCRFRVLDLHGQWWQGRGAGPSMCCTLRAMGSPRGR